MSKTGDKFYLMDGQQRSTSIFLGHFNPFEITDALKAWAIKGELPVLWIDLQPSKKPDAAKYSIRITTKSHPWGYQAIANGNILSSSDRRKAFEIFKKNPNNSGQQYSQFKNTNVFPFDCTLPLPLCFFIESSTVEQIIDKAKKHLSDYFMTKDGDFKDKSEFLNKLYESEVVNNITKLFNVVKKSLNTTIFANVIDNTVLDEENEAENPTLFVRINSGGTTLSGDDLIFSIYKSAFPESKDIIEKIGMDFIAPTVVLSFITRLVSSDLKEDKGFTKKLNVREFQQRLKNDPFKDCLQNLIVGELLTSAFKKAIDILSGAKNSLFEGEVPPVLVKQFIKRNQDLFLFFVYWLYVHQTEIKIDENLQLKMIGKLYSCAWFGFKNVTELWNEEINNRTFWTESINKLMICNDGCAVLVDPALLRMYYSQETIFKSFKSNDANRWGLIQSDASQDIQNYYNEMKNNLDETQVKTFFQNLIDKIRKKNELIQLQHPWASRRGDG